MKTSILLAAGAAAMLLYAPSAFAQDAAPIGAAPTVRDTGNWTLKQREDWLNSHIDKAHDEHDIDGREADRTHHELDLIKDDESHMRDHHDGQLTDNETAALETRLDDMAAKIHWLHQNAFQRPW
jgi:hypothetical protein